MSKHEKYPPHFACLALFPYTSYRWLEKTEITAFSWLIAMMMLMVAISIMTVLYLCYWAITTASNFISCLFKSEMELNREK